MILAKGKLVVELLKAYKQNDTTRFEKVVNKIIKDEEESNHKNIAKQIRSVMEDYEQPSKFEYHHSLNYINKLPKDIDKQSYLVDVKYPKIILEDIILASGNKELIEDILEEQYNSFKIRSFNLRPKQKILFCGPPGCGKTITAEAISGELGLPLIYIRLDAIVSSYLGDTASNLRKVFDYISSGRFVVFFDEFDAIGKSRSDSNEHGELKRVVNSFLQMVDNYSGDNIIIAATNHQNLLDSAVWRRFDEIIYFGNPEEEDIEKLIKLKTKVFPKKNIEFNKIIELLMEMSHSEIEMICLDSMKYCIKNDEKILTTDIIIESINKHKRRRAIYKNMGYSD